RPKFTCRSRACRERHPDTFAFVVITATSNGSDVARSRAKIVGQHFGIALKSARGENCAFSSELASLAAGAAGHDDRNAAGLIAQKFGSRGPIKSFCAQAFCFCCKALDNREAPSIRIDPPRVLSEFIAR